MHPVASCKPFALTRGSGDTEHMRLEELVSFLAVTGGDEPISIEGVDQSPKPRVIAKWTPPDRLPVSELPGYVLEYKPEVSHPQRSSLSLPRVWPFDAFQSWQAAAVKATKEWFSTPV